MPSINLNNYAISKKRHVKFRSADIARALKGAKASGIDPMSVKICTDGCIIIDFKSDSNPTVESDYDKWVQTRGKIAA